MSARELHGLSAGERARAVASGEVAAVEATRAYLERIGRFDRALHAYLHVDAEDALAQAAAVDRARAQGAKLSVLAGVPIGLKDNMCVRGQPTTCASRILEGYRPPYDATAIERLRAAGADLLG